MKGIEWWPSEVLRCEEGCEREIGGEERGPKDAMGEKLADARQPKHRFRRIEVNGDIKVPAKPWQEVEMPEGDKVH